MFIKKTALFLVIITTIFTGCNTTSIEKDVFQPPNTFVESDLIGEWKTLSETYAIETLEINDNYTFKQTYKSNSSLKNIEIHGKWSIEHRLSGCVYLYMYGMKYFHLSPEIARNGNRLSDGSPILFRERCEDKKIIMLDGVTLSIGRREGFPRNIVLQFPRSNSEGLDTTMQLIKPR